MVIAFPRRAAARPLSRSSLLRGAPFQRGRAATTLRVFGSAGAESALTPANTASPLNPNNVAAIPYSTNSGDVTAFVEAMPESRAWKMRLKARADDIRSRRRTSAKRARRSCSSTRSRGSTSPRAASSRSGAPATRGIRPSFIGPRKNPADPNDRRSSYRGIEMIKSRPLRPRHERLALRAAARRVRRARLPPRARHRHLARHAP